MGTAPYQLGLTSKCQGCLFATRMTTPPTSLYTIIGSNPVANEAGVFDVSGNNNYYKNTKVVLRVESSGDKSAVEEYTFDDFESPEGHPWFSERNPRPATVFSWPPPLQTVDRQRLEDFMQPGIFDGWFLWDLDIAPAGLPELPDFTPPDSAEPKGLSSSVSDTSMPR